jgi:hypothetical protein
MAQSQNKRLDAGDSFPDLALTIAGDGATREFPKMVQGAFSALLFYRGVW